MVQTYPTDLYLPLTNSISPKVDPNTEILRAGKFVQRYARWLELALWVPVLGTHMSTQQAGLIQR